MRNVSGRAILPDLTVIGKLCKGPSNFIFDTISFTIAGNKDSHKTLDHFDLENIMQELLGLECGQCLTLNVIAF